MLHSSMHTLFVKSAFLSDHWDDDAYAANPTIIDEWIEEHSFWSDLQEVKGHSMVIKQLSLGGLDCHYASPIIFPEKRQLDEALSAEVSVADEGPDQKKQSKIQRHGLNST